MLLGSAVSLSLKQENVDSFFARWINIEKKVPKTKAPPWVRCMDDQWMNVIFLLPCWIGQAPAFPKNGKTSILSVDRVIRLSHQLTVIEKKFNDKHQKENAKLKNIVKIVNHIMFFYLLPFDKIVLFKYISHL